MGAGMRVLDGEGKGPKGAPDVLADVGWGVIGADVGKLFDGGMALRVVLEEGMGVMILTVGLGTYVEGVS